MAGDSIGLGFSFFYWTAKSAATNTHHVAHSLVYVFALIKKKFDS